MTGEIPPAWCGRKTFDANLPFNVHSNILLTHLFSVHRPLVRSDLGYLLLSPRSAHHSVRRHLLWVWLYSMDASDTVCLYPSVQLRWTHVANCVQ